MSINYESLCQATAEYLGIAGLEEEIRLRSYVESAVELTTEQTGETEFTSGIARQYVKFTAAQMYADRFGELNNKEGSAMKQLMNNFAFILRIRNGRWNSIADSDDT
ncbi:MAG: hypothetical protein IIT39_07890 [Clostridia bacterium]|nr:hypothetical protein [Clostridia bacterium]